MPHLVRKWGTGQRLLAGFLLMFVFESSVYAVASDSHGDQGEAFAHCTSQAAAAAAERQANVAWRGANNYVQAKPCANSGSQYSCQFELRDIPNNGLWGTYSCGQFVSTYANIHVYSTLCTARPDENIFIESIADSSGQMVPQISNPYCENGCTVNVSIGGVSSNCHYTDANSNGTADEGEVGACPAVMYADPVGVCSTTNTPASGPGSDGSTECDGDDCSTPDTGGGGPGGGGPGGGGPGGGGPGGGGGGPVVPPGGGSGTPTPAPIPGDDDSSGTCEPGEACDDTSGETNELLAAILGALTGEGMDTGLDGNGYIGDGIEQGEEMMEREANDNTLDTAINVGMEFEFVPAIQEGLEDFWDGTTSTCPVISGDIPGSRGQGLEIDTGIVGDGFRAIATLVLWLSVAGLAWTAIFRTQS